MVYVSFLFFFFDYFALNLCILNPNSSACTSFLYEDMGSSLIDNYEFLVSKLTLQQVDDRTYGGPDHCTPIQEQRSCTSFLYKDKDSFLPGYYELLESNASLQQVEDMAYGGFDHGIPIQNQSLAIKVEGEHKCKRSFAEFFTSFEGRLIQPCGGTWGPNEHA
ncbi:uncharacterized protein LOC144554147 isoform X2 [Carex rostrata]